MAYYSKQTPDSMNDESDGLVGVCPNDESKLLRVACWICERKAKRVHFPQLYTTFRNAGMELVMADFHVPISKQGRFHAVVHKLVEHIIKSDQGCSSSISIINDFENYIKKYPDMVIIDPLTSLRKITDRSKQYKLIEESGSTQKNIVCVPTFVSLTSMDLETNLKKLKEAKVKFPFVCKPLMADGTNSAHQMALIFNEQGLNDISIPCVAQTFINHNALLFKIFVIGEQYHVTERPSLKNFSSKDQKSIFFHTEEVSKSSSKSALTKLDEEDSRPETLKLDKNRLDKIVQLISRNMKLNLYGIDIIIEKDTGQHAIIDMNPFPSYDGMDNFPQVFTDYVLKKIHSKLGTNLNSESCMPNNISTDIHS